MRRNIIVQRIKAALSLAAPKATVILYGSEARGEARTDSDIDLLILLDKEYVSLKDKEQVYAPLYDIELDSNVLISSLILSKSDWEQRPFTNQFYLNVIKDGIVL